MTEPTEPTMTELLTEIAEQNALILEGQEEQTQLLNDIYEHLLELDGGPGYSITQES